MLGLMFQVGACPSCQQSLGYYCPQSATWCYVYPPQDGGGQETDHSILLPDLGHPAVQDLQHLHGAVPAVSNLHTCATVDNTQVTGGDALNPSPSGSSPRAGDPSGSGEGTLQASVTPTQGHHQHQQQPECDMSQLGAALPSVPCLPDLSYLLTTQPELLTTRPELLTTQQCTDLLTNQELLATQPCQELITTQPCTDIGHLGAVAQMAPCPACSYNDGLNAYICGYQSYPTGHAVAAPPPQATVPVSAAAVAAAAAAAAASAARFPRQPVSLTPANGTFRPSLAPTTSPQGGPRPLRPTFNGAGSRGPSPGFHNSKQFRPGFHKSGAFRAMKRKLSDDAKSDSGDSNGKADSTSGDLLQPLYCKICRVTLNAPAQAKQHYEGKNHSKKVKLYMEGSSSSENGSSSGDQSSSSSNGTPSEPPKEINPEIYCKVCGVSFNSPKQAQQHYQGKNHAKKLRASHQAHPGISEKLGSKFGCYVCNIQMSTQEQLDTHLKGSRHLALKSAHDTSTSALRGKWAGKPAGGTGATLPDGICRLPEGGSSGPPASSGFPSPPSKRPKRDFSMYRTPSGKYYCSCCNVAVSSDMQFAQHVDSRKHKMNNAVKRSTETNNNNTSPEPNATT